MSMSKEQDRHASKERAKAIILNIIRQNGGIFEGKTRLFKAFYFAHLYYYKDAHMLLTDWPIVRLPEGPGIHAGTELIQELRQSGRISTSARPNGPFIEEVYSLEVADTPEMNEAERSAIDKTCEFVHGKSANMLSDLTHEESRSWKKRSNGDELNIYVDLQTDEEYDDNRRELKRLNDLIRGKCPE